MKNILAENMLRFGVKNLNETATSKVKQLAEQAPVQPALLKPVNNIKIDSVEVFWNQGEQKSIAKINVVPSSDNKYYMIAGINLTTPDNKNPYTFQFKKPLTFTKGANYDSSVKAWKPIIVDTLKSADATKLFMYMNLPGGAVQTTGAGSSGSKTVSNPENVAIHLINGIFNATSEYKLTVS